MQHKIIDLGLPLQETNFYLGGLFLRLQKRNMKILEVLCPINNY